MITRQLDDWLIVWTVLAALNFGIWKWNFSAGLFVLAVGFFINDLVSRQRNPR